MNQCMHMIDSSKKNVCTWSRIIADQYLDSCYDYLTIHDYIIRLNNHNNDQSYDSNNNSHKLYLFGSDTNW